ncbi:MAG: hypothetical protein JNM75_10115 [Rhodospirillales bacterium]|nr:hypothetical protein [Rhodospirillales bacterium]
MFIGDTSVQIQACDAHIWWHGDGKVIKVVATDPVRTAQLTRAGYRYETGAAYRHWQIGTDEQRVGEMAALAVRLVADGFHPTMVKKEFAKVRQFLQLGGDAALTGSAAGASAARRAAVPADQEARF